MKQATFGSCRDLIRKGLRHVSFIVSIMALALVAFAEPIHPRPLNKSGHFSSSFSDQGGRHEGN